MLRGKRSHRQGGKASKTLVDHQGLLNTAKCFLLFISLLLYGDVLYLTFCPVQKKKKCKELEIEIWVYFHVHFSPAEKDTAVSPQLFPVPCRDRSPAFSGHLPSSPSQSPPW